MTPAQRQLGPDLFPGSKTMQDDRQQLPDRRRDARRALAALALCALGGSCSAESPALKVRVLFEESNGDVERWYRTCSGSMIDQIVVRTRAVKRLHDGWDRSADWTPARQLDCGDFHGDTVIIHDVAPVSHDVELEFISQAPDADETRHLLATPVGGLLDEADLPTTKVPLPTVGAGVRLQNTHKCDKLKVSLTYADEATQLVQQAAQDAPEPKNVCEEVDMEEGGKPFCRTLYRQGLASDRGLSFNAEEQDCAGHGGHHELLAIDPGAYRLTVNVDQDKYCSADLVLPGDSTVNVDVARCQPHSEPH
ncbi:MAG: hypothetical protein B7733_25170 [Myxococcales bacterium FL481]|nr:MAG: hypothetical protein B7733_25170 [Myxococcales bacterium FL481]